MATKLIISLILFVITIISDIVLWYDNHNQKYDKPIYSKEFL